MKQPPPPMELDYFPPRGTKYEWSPPVLKLRPWTARIELPGDRRYAILHVSRSADTLYHGFVRFYDLQGVKHEKETGRYLDPKEALLATEALAEAMVAEENRKLPSWANEALAAGWRPPKSVGYTSRSVNSDGCPTCGGQVVESHAGGMCTTPGCD